MRRTSARRPGRKASDPPDPSATWTQLPLAEPPAPPPAPPAAGEWIDALVADLAIELGDAERAAAHQAAARDLWRRSGLREGEFAKVLLAVRGQAKRWAGRRSAAPAGGPPVRMGAFFLLLRDRLGLIDATDPPRRRRSRVGDE
jgi:hypothetical protein